MQFGGWDASRKLEPQRTRRTQRKSSVSSAPSCSISLISSVEGEGLAKRSVVNVVCSIQDDMGYRRAAAGGLLGLPPHVVKERFLAMTAAVPQEESLRRISGLISRRAGTRRDEDGVDT